MLSLRQGGEKSKLSILFQTWPFSPIKYIKVDYPTTSPSVKTKEDIFYGSKHKNTVSTQSKEQQICQFCTQPSTFLCYKYNYKLPKRELGSFYGRSMTDIRPALSTDKSILVDSPKTDLQHSPLLCSVWCRKVGQTLGDFYE